MKKTYKTPEVHLVVIGDEIMSGLNQNSIGADGTLPGNTGIGDGGGSDSGDDPDAKRHHGFWDDEE